MPLLVTSLWPALDVVHDVYRYVRRCCPRAFNASIRTARSSWPQSRRSTSLRTEFPMIGLVLVTHGRLAHEFGAALEHIMGRQEQMEAITIGANDDPDLRRRAITEAVNRVDSGDGVAILTDMFGGTPSNLAISCMGRPNVDVLAGINMPMLVKLAKIRDECPLEEAVAAAQAAGRKYVTIASRVLAGK